MKNENKYKIPEGFNAEQWANASEIVENAKLKPLVPLPVVDPISTNPGVDPVDDAEEGDQSITVLQALVSVEPSDLENIALRISQAEQQFSGCPQRKALNRMLCTLAVAGVPTQQQVEACAKHVGLDL